MMKQKRVEEWLKEGIALRDLGRYEEAISCYDEALKIDPKNVVIWDSKGVALRLLGRYEEAIRCYDEVLKIEPDNANAYGCKGAALSNLRRSEDAIRCYDEALKINPNDVDTTVATSDNTYDRIIINDATENNLISFGVMDDVNSGQSDHYLVYGYFNNEQD